MFKDIKIVFDKSYFIVEKIPMVCVCLSILIIIILTIFLVRKEIKKL